MARFMPRTLLVWGVPPGKPLMEVVGNHYPRVMAIHDKTRLIGPFPVN